MAQSNKDALSGHEDVLLDLYTHPDNDSRIWVGNLDSRVTEFELLRLFGTCGTVKKLDFLFHKTGSQAGQPRGYVFLTFEKREGAIKARRDFDGKTLLGRRMLVKTARSVNKEDLQQNKSSSVDIPALRGAKDEKQKADVDQKIKAIEAKLKMMQHEGGSPSIPANFVSPLSRSAVRNVQQPYNKFDRKKKH